ncbi:phosphomannomutase/phosphoglucomutase [Patescibacteria group bacterium]
MKINPNIFRAYDIRGLYPKEINEKVAYSVGQAFAIYLLKQRKIKNKLNIAVGQDNRLSSPSLFKNLVKGILDQGVSVVDIGLSTTPMFYFAVGFYKLDGGINITGSHLRAEYNGFKLVKDGTVPVSEKTGLKEIKKLATKEIQPSFKKGKILKKNVTSPYLEFNFKDFRTSTFKSFKLVVDTANAVTGILIPPLRKKLPFQIYSLFEKLDGNFPNHPPDPLIKKNLRFLQKEVKNKKADLGIAFDGDGDRILFVDEKGKIISGDMIFALLAKLILRERPGAKIMSDIRSSKIIKEVVKKNGGKFLIGKIGHSLIKEKMRKEDIVFAGELSGHYYYKNHYFCESPFFVLFKILEEISLTKKSLFEMIKPYQKYFHSGEINFKISNKEKKIRKLEKRFKSGSVSHLDGLRIDFENWWFSIRSSQTEPLLRLVVEAETKKLMEEKKKEITKIISNPSSF